MRALALLALAVVLAGCVTQSTYDATLTQKTDLQEELRQANATLADLRNQLVVEQARSASNADEARRAEASLQTTYETFRDAFAQGDLFEGAFVTYIGGTAPVVLHAVPEQVVETRAAGVFRDPTKLVVVTISCASHSMTPTLKCTDLALARPNPESLQVGDIASYEIPTTDPGNCAFAGKPIIHRVVAVTTGADGVARYTFKGDDNPANDDCSVPITMVTSLVVATEYGVYDVPGRLQG